MTGRRALIVVILAVAIVAVARGGHEVPIYPSYYPHEIELSAVTPERAAELLSTGKIQAYVGGVPRFAATPPASVDSVESLGSFVTVRVNPASTLLGDGRTACTIVDAVMHDLAGKGGALVFHPYPVTPFHGDYLHHVDLAEAAKAAAASPQPTGPDLQGLKLRAAGEVARSLVRAEWLAPASEWDAEVAAVGASDLLASAQLAMNGWLGPAWLRTGWFHAFLLLRQRIGDEALARRIDADLERLKAGDHGGAVERINLERSFVAALAGNCRMRVAGYTVKREYFSTVFTAGIENIAFDALAGLNAPIFVRTVKLRDFPWNGWLALGVSGAPEAAWNPIAGFGDNFGRLMWSAVGDPASIPSPYESTWMLNRVTDVRAGAGR
jgi:hypothetical protein